MATLPLHSGICSSSRSVLNRETDRTRSAAPKAWPSSSRRLSEPYRRSWKTSWLVTARRARRVGRSTRPGSRPSRPGRSTAPAAARGPAARPAAALRVETGSSRRGAGRAGRERLPEGQAVGLGDPAGDDGQADLRAGRPAGRAGRGRGGSRRSAPGRRSCRRPRPATSPRPLLRRIGRHRCCPLRSPRAPRPARRAAIVAQGGRPVNLGPTPGRGEFASGATSGRALLRQLHHTE